MWRFFRAVSIVVVVYCCGSAAVTAAEKCNPSDAISAEEGIDVVKTAADLYKFFRRYSQCDDGAITEGIDESIARILVDHWYQVSKLNYLAISDKAFKKFILKHLRDGTGNLDDYRAINISSSQHCPADSRIFCKLIADATKTSVSELRLATPAATP